MIIHDPSEIERRSFEIISSELKTALPPDNELVVKRVIHTTADFDYAENLVFSKKAVSEALAVLRRGCGIVTDTQMASAGINKAAAGKLGCSIYCFMGDPGVAKEAQTRGWTRAAVSMERAAALSQPLIFAVGNAPTALLSLCDLIQNGKLRPALVIGVPVGFVNVIEAKEAIMASGVSYIVARGRKGGSNVAAAIVNALMYQITR